MLDFVGCNYHFFAFYFEIIYYTLSINYLCIYEDDVLFSMQNSHFSTYDEGILTATILKYIIINQSTYPSELQDP